MQCTDCESTVDEVIRLRALIKQLVRNVHAEHLATLDKHCDPADVLIIRELLSKARKEVAYAVQ